MKPSRTYNLATVEWLKLLIRFETWKCIISSPKTNKNEIILIEYGKLITNSQSWVFITNKFWEEILSNYNYLNERSKAKEMTLAN